NTAAVGVGHGVARRDDRLEQLAKCETMLGLVQRGCHRRRMVAVAGLLEGFTLDKAHGVTRLSRRVGDQAVDRNDAGMLEVGGDLSLATESLNTLCVGGKAFLNALQGDAPAQLGVLGKMDFAQPTARVQFDATVAGASGGKIVEETYGRPWLVERVR